MGFKEGLYVTLSRGSIPSFFRFFFWLKISSSSFLQYIYIVTLAMISEVEI
jgi:hypothetical protein